MPAAEHTPRQHWGEDDGNYLGELQCGRKEEKWRAREDGCRETINGRMQICHATSAVVRFHHRPDSLPPRGLEVSIHRRRFVTRTEGNWHFLLGCLKVTAHPDTQFSTHRKCRKVPHRTVYFLARLCAILVQREEGHAVHELGVLGIAPMYVMRVLGIAPTYVLLAKMCQDAVLDVLVVRKCLARPAGGGIRSLGQGREELPPGREVDYRHGDWGVKLSSSKQRDSNDEGKVCDELVTLDVSVTRQRNLRPSRSRPGRQNSHCHCHSPRRFPCLSAGPECATVQ